MLRKLILSNHHQIIRYRCHGIGYLFPSRDSCATDYSMSIIEKEKWKLVSIPAIWHWLGNGIYNAMPRLHSFSGCDTSGFYGKSKAAFFTLLKADTPFRHAMQELGNLCLSEKQVYASFTNMKKLMWIEFFITCLRKQHPHKNPLTKILSNFTSKELTLKLTYGNRLEKTF